MSATIDDERELRSIGCSGYITLTLFEIRLQSRPGPHGKVLRRATVAEENLKALRRTLDFRDVGETSVGDGARPGHVNVATWTIDPDRTVYVDNGPTSKRVQLPRAAPPLTLDIDGLTPEQICAKYSPTEIRAELLRSSDTIKTPPGVTTLAGAALLIGRGEASSCGVHRDGRRWIGFGHHENDNGREVVAPSIVLFLPATAEDVAAAQARQSR